METSRDNFILENRVAWSPPGYATRDLLFSEMGLPQQHNTPVVSVNMKSVPSTTKNRQSQMESERHFNALKDPRLHIEPYTALSRDGGRQLRTQRKVKLPGHFIGRRMWME